MTLQRVENTVRGGFVVLKQDNVPASNLYFAISKVTQLRGVIINRAFEIGNLRAGRSAVYLCQARIFDFAESTCAPDASGRR